MSESPDTIPDPSPPLLSPDERFLSRKNLVLACWGLVLTAVASLSGYLWLKVEGPPQVIVQSSLQDPALQHAITQTELLREISLLQSSLAKAIESGVTQSELQLRSLESFALEISNLIALLTEGSADSDERMRAILERTLRSIEATKYEQIEQEVEQNTLRQELSERNAELKKAIEQISEAVRSPTYNTGKAVTGSIKFSLPTSAKGYAPTALRGIRRATCPNSTLSSEATLLIKFYVSRRELLLEASPLILRLSRVASDGTGLFRVFERAYLMEYGQNELIESLELAPGDYDLRYGYHMLSELDEEFPPYYSKHCRFSVPPSQPK